VIESTTHYTADDGRTAVVTIARGPGRGPYPAMFAASAVLDDGRALPPLEAVELPDPDACLRLALDHVRAALVTR
jgi:hypothetical protein